MCLSINQAPSSNNQTSNNTAAAAAAAGFKQNPILCE
jgi:hypothetical protein